MSGVFVKNIYQNLIDSDIETQVVHIKHQSKSKLLNYLYFYLEVIKRIYFLKPAVVYVHFVSHSCLPVVLCKLFVKFRLISNIHGSDAFSEIGTPFYLDKIKKVMTKIGIFFSDSIVVPSKYFKQKLIDAYECQVKDIFVSPSGGVNLSMFDYKKTNGERTYITFIGRLSVDKGIDDFLNLSKHFKDVQFLIIGKGPKENEVNAAVKRQQNLTFIQGVEQSKLPFYLNQSKVFVFPTYRESESLGLVGLEAMAMGVPVIAYPMGGPLSYIEDCANGFITPSCDQTSLIDSLNKFFALSDEQVKGLSDKAYQTSREYCSILITKNLIEHLNSYLPKKYS